jgi:hypothetical protein
VPPRIEIVQRVEDDAECLEPRDIEARVLDVVVICFDLDFRVEFACRFFCNLSHVSACPATSPACPVTAYQRLGLLDMLGAEQELPVQVAEVDRVQVDDVDLAKARKYKVLEQLAPDATRSHHQYARLVDVSIFCTCSLRQTSPTSLIRSLSCVPRLRAAKVSRAIACAVEVLAEGEFVGGVGAATT